MKISSEIDLRDPEGLRAACEQAQRKRPVDVWERDLAAFLDKVAAASESERASEAFQRLLWEGNPVCETGMGTVNVEAALADADFRAWIARESMAPLPAEQDARLGQLTTLRDRIIEKLKVFTVRTPHLKINRVLAAFFPHDFTVMAGLDKMRDLHKTMFGVGSPGNPVAMHADVVERLKEVLGPTGNDTLAVAERMALPWKLYDLVASLGKKKDEAPGEPAQALHPLPAARRRRGLTAIAGGFNGMLDILEYLRDGATRADLLDYLRSRSPTARDSSLSIVANVLQSEFAVITREGEKYVLTERGESVLESGEPDDLDDWLLTRVLGPDYVLARLRDEGSVDKAQLIAGLQKQNPGWTTDFGPQALMSWLRSFSVVEVTADGKVRLTPAGKAGPAGFTGVRRRCRQIK